MTLLIVLFSILSQRLEATLPTAAFYLNPLNPDARLHRDIGILIDNERERGGEAPDPAVANSIRNWLFANPGDARMYSALGIAARQASDNERADRLFESALKLSKTEQFALLQMFVRRATQNRFDEAVQHADTLIRRWPLRRNDLAVAIRSLAGTKEGYTALMAQARQSQTLRSVIIASLVSSSESLPQLYSALLEMQSADPPPSDQEVSQAIEGLIARNDAASAYRLFLLTLPENERKRAGTIFNGKMLVGSTGKRFDWQTKPTKGIEIVLPAPGGGARFMFQDRPVTRIIFNQSVLLTPGSYRLVVQASANELDTPRGLFMTMKCEGRTELPLREMPKERVSDLLKQPVKASDELVRLQIPPGSYQREYIRESFTIPLEDCPMQQISVISGLVTETWALKYKGSVLISSVEIERQQ